MKTAWHDVAATDAVPENGGLEFRIDGTPGFIIRTGRGLQAYVNRCPHLGIELNWMPGRFLEASGCFIQCATHGALFTPETGHCIAGPCQGENLSPLEVSKADGRVLVRLSPERQAEA
ncbi:Rieske (2Fe-2S) protein [Marinobacter sp.]|uniref:Rieske (2Fe-2S) protein n=1 Tax=Marinobacter sp. TaxID=50741 RepID=UPI00384EC8E8